MANDRNYQRNKQGVLTSLKVYISIVSILASYLKLLQVAFASCLPSLSLPFLVRLLPQGDFGLYLCLYLFYCAAYSFRTCVQILARIVFVLAYSILGGYVQKFYIFSSNLHGIYACIFNS